MRVVGERGFRSMIGEGTFRSMIAVVRIEGVRRWLLSEGVGIVGFVKGGSEEVVKVGGEEVSEEMASED